MGSTIILEFGVGSTIMVEALVGSSDHAGGASR